MTTETEICPVQVFATALRDDLERAGHGPARASGKTHHQIAQLPNGAVYVIPNPGFKFHVYRVLENQGRQPQALECVTVEDIVFNHRLDGYFGEIAFDHATVEQHLKTRLRRDMMTEALIRAASFGRAADA